MSDEVTLEKILDTMNTLHSTSGKTELIQIISLITNGIILLVLVIKPILHKYIDAKFAVKNDNNARCERSPGISPSPSMEYKLRDIEESNTHPSILTGRRNHHSTSSDEDINNYIEHDDGSTLEFLKRVINKNNINEPLVKDDVI